MSEVLKVIGWIQTDRVGSRVEREVEIPWEDLDGLDEDDRIYRIDEAVREVVFESIEWGWRDER